MLLVLPYRCELQLQVLLLRIVGSCVNLLQLEILKMLALTCCHCKFSITEPFEKSVFAMSRKFQVLLVDVADVLPL